MFLAILLRNVPTNFFVFKITNHVCPRHSVFNFFNHKIFFRPIWNIYFCKNVFILWYSNIITNFKFSTFLIIFFIKVNIHAWICISRFFNINRFVNLTMSSNLSIHTFFDIEVMYLYILFFMVLINVSASTDFPSFYTEYISVAFFLDMISLIYCKGPCLYLTIFNLV